MKPYRFVYRPRLQHLVILDDDPEVVNKYLHDILARGWGAEQIHILLAPKPENPGAINCLEERGIDIKRDVSFFEVAQVLANLRCGVFACDGRLWISPNWPEDDPELIDGSEIVSRMRVNLGHIGDIEGTFFYGYWLMGVWSGSEQNEQSEKEQIPWWSKWNTARELPTPPKEQ